MIPSQRYEVIVVLTRDKYDARPSSRDKAITATKRKGLATYERLNSRSLESASVADAFSRELQATR